MRDCEQIAQVAHEKCATVSNLFRSLIKNERLRESLIFSEQIVHSHFWSQQTNHSFKSFWLKSYFLYIFVKWVICSFPLFNERCERITQFAHQKWATMSNLLTKNEWMSESLVFSANRSFSLFANNEQFAQKTDERIPNHAKNQGENSQPWDKHKK